MKKNRFMLFLFSFAMEQSSSHLIQSMFEYVCCKIHDLMQHDSAQTHYLLISYKRYEWHSKCMLTFTFMRRVLEAATVFSHSLKRTECEEMILKKYAVA
jgi:hypothetical protein